MVALGGGGEHRDAGSGNAALPVQEMEEPHPQSEELDINAVMRRRKEARVLKRATIAPRSRLRATGKPVSVDVDDGDEGNNADVE